MISYQKEARASESPECKELKNVCLGASRFSLVREAAITETAIACRSASTRDFSLVRLELILNLLMGRCNWILRGNVTLPIPRPRKLTYGFSESPQTCGGQNLFK
jgi:hypothetical protein